MGPEDLSRALDRSVGPQASVDARSIAPLVSIARSIGGAALPVLMSRMESGSVTDVEVAASVLMELGPDAAGSAQDVVGLLAQTGDDARIFHCLRILASLGRRRLADGLVRSVEPTVRRFLSGRGFAIAVQAHETYLAIFGRFPTPGGGGQ